MNRGGTMAPIYILTGLGVAMLIGAVVIYAMHENNSYDQLLRAVKDTNGNANGAVSRCDSLGVQFTRLENVLSDIMAHDSAGVKELRKAIAESQREISSLQSEHLKESRAMKNETEILKTRQYSLEKSILKKEQTVNHNHTITNGATPFSVIDATPPAPKKSRPLLEKAGVTAQEQL